MQSKDIRLYDEREDYIVFKGENNNSTENSNTSSDSENNKLSQFSKGIIKENEAAIKEVISCQEEQEKEVDCIEIHNSNGSDSQTHKFRVIKVEAKDLCTKTKEEKKIRKDNNRITIFRMAMNFSILNFLNHICETHKLKIRKVNVKRLIKNIKQQRWFLRKTIKYLFCKNSNRNKKVFREMIKKDELFGKFVNYTFEKFYKEIFLFEENGKEKIYILLDPITEKAFKLSKFQNFNICLTKIKKYAKEEAKLRTIGYNLIKDIKGNGNLHMRCNRKKFRTKIYFLGKKKNSKK